MSAEYLNDQVKPYNEHEDKTSQLVKLFNSISGEYDTFNFIASLGLSNYWRRRAVSMLEKNEPKNILDIATGTGDMCIIMTKKLMPEAITGIDISDKMLAQGREKIEKISRGSRISLIQQDCVSMSFDDNNFDAVTISFGIRNLEKLSQCLTEIYRVLKPEGHFLIIEVNEPKSKILNLLYRTYMHIIIVITSGIFQHDKKAYSYLANSMKVFPNRKRLLSILSEFGFKPVRTKSFTLGVCSAYLLHKPSV